MDFVSRANEASIPARRMAHLVCLIIILPDHFISLCCASDFRIFFFPTGIKAYERSLPVLSERLNDDGLVNVVVGGSGNNEGIDRKFVGERLEIPRKK